jgi:deoxyribonuclease V
MRLEKLHAWKLTTTEAREVQRALAPGVKRSDDFGEVKRVCGVDIGFKGGAARAACAVLSFPDLEPLEMLCLESPVEFPYVPGLLSFREIPPLIPVLERLVVEPDLFIADGQGIAHPRRFGLASHLGLILDKPVIGCAKSRLLGVFREPGPARGEFEPLLDGGEIVGAVLRTENKVKPVFVSVGHRVSLETSIGFVLGCCRGHRLPEPIRFAHRLASGGPGVEGLGQSNDKVT